MEVTIRPKVEKHIFKIRRPLLVRGTKAAEMGFILFLSISSHCYSAIRLCFYVFRRPRANLHPQIPHLGCVVITKILLFSNLFSMLKKSENRLPRPPKNDTSPSQNPLNTISLKNLFLQYFPCENHELEVPNIDIPSQTSIKR